MNKRASRRDNMKINEWGVFVERPDKSILSGNTKGKILW